jgi:hypothetical protein
MYKLNGKLPETIMLGQTADISFICSFAWYNWVYYNEHNAAFPASKMTLGRYLGPTDSEAGSVLSAKILTLEGNMIRHNTFRRLTPLEDANNELITAKTKVNSRLGDPIKDHLEFNDLVKISSVTLSNDESINLTDMTYDPDVMDTYITAEVLLPRGDAIKLGKVVRRLTDENNLPTGKAHDNPILDTREYAVEFDDGEQLEYAANAITENIYAQVDAEGRKYMLMDSTIDHRKHENAVPKDDEYVVVNGKRNRKKTTEGWQFNIQ